MFASITCPACRHKYTIPEGAMGSRQNCPNCRTPFLAGKSVSEGATADVPMKFEPAAAAATAGINKTMLGETGPPVKYNCPRCKKPLESPAAEAGVKKPCPACGQRLQVPQPPPPPPGLNKTMLVGDENATGVAPGAPPGSLPVGSILPGPAPAAAGQAPAGSVSTKRLAMIAGVVCGCIFLLLCTCLLAILFSGPSAAEREKMAAAQKQYADAQRELQELKRDMQMKEALAAQEKAMQAKMDMLMAEYKSKQDSIERDRERDRERYQNDQQKAAEVKAAADRRQREIDDERTKAMLKEKESKDNLAKLQSELDAMKQRQQQAATVVAQPPPVVYSYPYYHPYRYWSPWGY